MEKNTQKKVQAVGEITFTAYKPPKTFKNKVLNFLKKFGLISRGFLINHYEFGAPIRQQTDYNLITNAGFNVVAQVLAGEYADTGAVSHMTLGDGVGTPTVNDIALFNEVYRNETASGTSAINQAIFTAVYFEAEIDGTFTEFGNFIDGTLDPDSGEMWSHVNVDWTKTSEETLVVQCKYTFTNKP